MKYLILLAFVALSSASVFNYGGYRTQREIRVDEDRRIFLRSLNKVVIVQVPKDDPKCIEIIVKDPNRMVKVIKINSDKQVVKQVSLVSESGTDGVVFEGHDTEIDDQKIRERKPQVDLDNPQMRLLINIFRKYEGVAGEGTLYQLLKEVKQAVDRRELNSIVYDVISELEVKPTNTGNMSKYGLGIKTSEVEDETKEARQGEEAEKLRDFRSKFDDVRRDTETVAKGNFNKKSELAESLQATRQIEWIQGLLENRRRQEWSDSRRGDHTREVDEFLRSVDHSGRKDSSAFRQMLLQTNIHEIQRQIIREQLTAQELEIQQQFLNGQKQQLKLRKLVGHLQGLQTTQMQELSEACEQIRKLEEKLIEEQLDISKTLRKLQERLIKEYEELREDVKQEDLRERKY